MFRVLVVCIGNVCRSPLAERLLASELPRTSFSVTSAGVAALAGAPMDRTAAQELTRLGGSAEGFHARQLSPRLVSEADLVLTATTAVRSRVLEDSPGALRRTFTLLEFAELVRTAPAGESPSALVAAAARARSSTAGHDLDIADPHRQDLTVHTVVADQIDQAVSQVAASIGGHGGGMSEHS